MIAMRDKRRSKPSYLAADQVRRTNKNIYYLGDLTEELLAEQRRTNELLEALLQQRTAQWQPTPP